jgi:uncharacterized protein YacL
MRRPHLTRVPNAVVELLRLFSVVFFAALGSLVGAQLDLSDTPLGSFDGSWVGIIVGSGLGYVIGGMLGRRTVKVVSSTEVALRSVSAEEIVGGVFGGLVGALVGAAVAWPVFFVGPPAMTVPIFAFVLVTAALLGFRVGAAKRESMIGIFGAHAGMAPRTPSASSLPMVVDTSVAIDGRVIDIVRAGFLHGRMLVVAPVIAELQGLADAGDEHRRSKGRRGLDVLEALKRESSVDVTVVDDSVPAVPEVDAKLVRLCIDRDAALLTLDTNLAKAAAVAGVRVLNLHALVLALRPVVTAGDEVSVLLSRAGKEPGQGVGYLDDGTMVVVEKGRASVGSEVRIVVTSVVTTANGRLVFGRRTGQPAREPARSRG